MFALIAGVAPNIIGFLRSVKMMGGGPDVWDTIYPYSWFTGVLFAGTVYWMFSPTQQGRIRRAA
jgi:cytosine/uracil/thiamine/allantoin permease